MSDTIGNAYNLGNLTNKFKQRGWRLEINTKTRLIFKNMFNSNELSLLLTGEYVKVTSQFLDFEDLILINRTLTLLGFKIY